GPATLEELGHGEQQRGDGQKQRDQRAVQVDLGGDQDEGQDERAPGLRPQQRTQQLDERTRERADAVQFHPLRDQRPRGQEDEQQVDVLRRGYGRLQDGGQARQRLPEQVGEEERQHQHGDVLEKDAPLEGLVAGHGRTGPGRAGGLRT